jgi:cell division protein FtsL
MSIEDQIKTKKKKIKELQDEINELSEKIGTDFGCMFR